MHNLVDYVITAAPTYTCHHRYSASTDSTNPDNPHLEVGLNTWRRVLFETSDLASSDTKGNLQGHIPHPGRANL
jgi:hypothetical protein